MSLARWAGVILCLGVILFYSSTLIYLLLAPAFLAGSLSAPLWRRHED